MKLFKIYQNMNTDDDIYPGAVICASFNAG